MPRTAAIIVARAAATRLPGKMTLPFGRSTVVETVVERMRACTRVNDFVFATSTSPQDDVFAPLMARAGLPVVRGSETDVVARMRAALDALSPAPDIIVRVCSDNPMMMPAIVDQAVELLLDTRADIVTPFELNTLPFGYGMVVMTAETLRRIDAESSEKVHREHVENFCFDNPDRFRIAYQVAPEGCAWPRLGLSLDHAEDYRRLVLAHDLVADLPPERQHDLLVRRLAEARVGLVGAGMQPVADALDGWLVRPPEFLARPEDGFDLLLGTGPLPEAARGSFTIVDGAVLDGQGRLIGRAEAMRELAPVLLGGHPRPEALRPDGLPAADKLGSGRRRGFASRAAAVMPTEVWCAPGCDTAGIEAARQGTPPAMPVADALFHRLLLEADGSLSHEGPGGHRFARLADGIGPAWRGAAMTAARARALNALL